MLALLLIVTDALDDFANDHVSAGEDGDNASAERDFAQINDAISAIVRWLVNQGGATSPLLPSYFPKGCLASRREAVATALARERELPALASEEVRS